MLFPYQRRSIAIRLFVYSCFGGLVAVFPASVRGASPGLAPTSLVVALDQSRSLTVSDPDDNRIKGVKELIRTLAQFAQDTRITFSLVEFGGPVCHGPKLAVAPQLLTPTTAQGIAGQIQPKSRLFKCTDFVTALQLAWERVTAEPSGTPPDLRRLVVLFTDGAPAPNGKRELDFTLDEPGFCGTLPSEASPGRRYMCNLKQRWQELMKKIPVELYVVGLDARGEWWPKVGRYWQEVCGGEHCAVKTTNPAEMIAGFILPALMARGYSYQLCESGSCYIGPFVTEADFYIFGSTDNQIRQPTRGILEEGSLVGRRRGDNRDFWYVREPERGHWQVSSNRAEARMIVFLAQEEKHLDLQLEPERPTLGGNFTVTARMVTAQGTPFMGPAARLPVEHTQVLRLLDASGTPISVVSGDLVYNERTPVSCVFTGPIRIDAPGLYHLRAELSFDGKLVAAGDRDLEVPCCFSTPTPSIAPTRTPSASKAPIATATPTFSPTSSPTSTVTPQLILSPSDGGEEFLTEEYGLLHWYPLRIAKPRDLRLKLRATVDLPSAKISLRLRVTDPSPCSLATCDHTKSVDPKFLREPAFPASVPSAWRDVARASAEAEVQTETLSSDRPWVGHSNTLDVSFRRPRWSEIWEQTGAGYWVPVLIAFMLLALMSLALNRFKSPWRSSVVQYANIGAKRLGDSDVRRRILRLRGFLVWRAWGRSNGHLLYILSKRWVFLGRLVLRVIPSPQGVRDLTRYYRTFSIRPIWSAIRDATLGIVIDAPGIVDTSAFPGDNLAAPSRFDVGLIT